MKQFQELLSVKINVEKCEACWFGKTKHQNTQQARCKWTSLTNSFIKILGSAINYNKALADKKTFIPCLLIVTHCQKRGL